MLDKSTLCTTTAPKEHREYQVNAAREEIRLPKKECNRNVHFYKELNCVSANKKTMGCLVEAK